MKMSRTNIVLDDALLSKALQVTGLKTPRAVVHHALSELVRLEQQKSGTPAYYRSARGFPISRGKAPFNSADVLRVEEEEG